MGNGDERNINFLGFNCFKLVFWVYFPVTKFVSPRDKKNWNIEFKKENRLCENTLKIPLIDETILIFTCFKIHLHFTDGNGSLSTVRITSLFRGAFFTFSFLLLMDGRIKKKEKKILASFFVSYLQYRRSSSVCFLLECFSVFHFMAPYSDGKLNSQSITNPLFYQSITNPLFHQSIANPLFHQSITNSLFCQSIINNLSINQSPTFYSINQSRN